MLAVCSFSTGASSVQISMKVAQRILKVGSTVCYRMPLEYTIPLDAVYLPGSAVLMYGMKVFPETNIRGHVAVSGKEQKAHRKEALFQSRCPEQLCCFLPIVR